MPDWMWWLSRSWRLQIARPRLTAPGNGNAVAAAAALLGGLAATCPPDNCCVVSAAEARVPAVNVRVGVMG